MNDVDWTRPPLASLKKKGAAHDILVRDMGEWATVYQQRDSTFARWATPRIIRQLG